MGHEIDFLPVGEGERSGDAIALRFGDLSNGNQKVVVIDGGFKQTGEDLVNHIRKFYGTSVVDLAISTHPDADHCGGLQVVLERLTVRELWLHRPWQHTNDIARMFHDGRITDNSIRDALRRSLDNARELERIADQKDVLIREPFMGIHDQTGSICVVGPTKDFYEQLLPEFRGTPEPASSTGLVGRIAISLREAVHRVPETFHIETLTDEGETSAENNSSAIVLFVADDEYHLFTGDAGTPALAAACDVLRSVGVTASDLSFVQVPHHGSRHNVGPTVLDELLGPKVATDEKLKSAFASVSKEGEPKHPAKQVTNAFRRRGAYVYQTNGKGVCHHRNAPERPGWSSAEPIPFYSEVEHWESVDG